MNHKLQILGYAMMLLGGGCLLFAMVRPAYQPPEQAQATITDAVAYPKLEPYEGVPLDVEARILEQKAAQRLARVQADEAATRELIASQNLAQKEAQAKASQELALREQARQAALETVAELPTPSSTQATSAASVSAPEAPNDASTIPPDSNTPKSHKVTRGDTLIKLSRQYGIPVSVLASVNNMSPSDALVRGKTLRLPAPNELERLQQEALVKEAARAAKQNAQARLKEARSRGQKDGQYRVQVTLAANETRANEVAQALKKAGYKVTTHPTKGGVAVRVGKESNQEAANALRDVLKHDERIDAHGAWVVKE